MRRAVIDIGSNTVKLLVADVEGGTVKPVVAKDVTTRLGEGVNQTRRLAPSAIERTVAAVAGYAEEARALGAVEVLALTTSAARSAENAAEFLRACPLPVEVVSGEREAALIFRGASSDPAWAGQRLLVMDIGGGSAEWILGAGGNVERALSLPVGAVRLLERFGDGDFAGMSALLRAEFAARLAPFREAGAWRMIGTGGTIVTLAGIAARASCPCDSGKMNGQDARSTGPDHATLTLAEARELVSYLNALPLEQRRRVPGLPSERADIIVPGGAVLLFAMEALGAAELTVSVRALRFGALLEPRFAA